MAKKNREKEEKTTTVNQPSEEDVRRKIYEELLSHSKRYQNLIRVMASDVPLEVLCLKKKTEDLLRRHGFLRVYDLLDLDFAEIEFLDSIGIRDLQSRLEEFLSML